MYHDDAAAAPARPLRVLHFIDGGGGGALTQVLDLVGGLQRAGGDVKAEILFFTRGPAVEEARRRGISALVLPRGKSRLLFLRRLRRFLRGYGPDVLHTHTINGNFFGRVGGKLSGVPVLMTTVHSHIIDELKGQKRPSLSDYLRYGIDLVLARWCRALVTVTDAIRDRLIGHGQPPAKLRTIANAVDVSRFRADPALAREVRRELGIPDGCPVVGTVGRMVPLKNHDVFIAAARLARDRGSKAFFVLVGDGPMMEANRRQAAELGLGDAIVFTGWRGDMERLMPALDVLVMCSRVEGLNVSILEAMACGKPVVGTDVLGIRELVEQGRDGLLVPVGDAGALAAAVLELSGDPVRCAELGGRGRDKVVGRYSVETLVEAYGRLYHELVAR
jgi:glycosyltransferase involved in cell wall biosynthesis